MLCSVVATATGIALAALSIVRVESVAGRLLVGGLVIAIVVTAVLLVLSRELRAELSQLFSSVNVRMKVKREL